jgi:hypothetical protein
MIHFEWPFWIDECCGVVEIRPIPASLNVRLRERRVELREQITRLAGILTGG